MRLAQQYPSGIYLVDTEFHPSNGVEGNPPDPVCLVVHNLLTGETKRIWRDELRRMDKAPFPTDESALMIAFYASAEISCFLVLGWPLPARVLDLYAESRCLTNGKPPKQGNGLLGVLIHFGVHGIGAEEKSDMRDLILGRGPWTESQRNSILDYCESDVVALAKLFPILEPLIDQPRALLRGEYMVAAACIESNGIPIDLPLLDKMKGSWESIQERLIVKIDKDFGVFEGRRFKAELWKQYLINAGIPWRYLLSGALDLTDENFRDMASAYPQINPMRELRAMLSKMRLVTLSVGEDARNRCMLSAFRATTGRNQPSNSKSVFGPATGIRGLIKPAEGFGIAYVDWSQQEFGIAAALSEDEKMMEAYKSGDPYLAFAKQAGAVPHDATKASHKLERDQFKSTVLAVQYGMEAQSLALRINQTAARAQRLLNLHRSTYKKFWEFSDRCQDEAMLGGRLWTKFGWQVYVGLNANARSLRNFPMQAHGAEMLRIACILLNREGIRVCIPVHDAILIEAPLEALDSAVVKTQAIMAQASRIVLDGFELASEAKVVRYPDRYMDDRGISMWNTVMELLDEPAY